VIQKTIRLYGLLLIASILSGCGINNIPTFDEAVNGRWSEVQNQFKRRAVAEAYPDLKSNENFLALQQQLEGTENRISVARRDYISAVQRYNTELRTIPGRWWARFMYPDMVKKENFSISAEDAVNPTVNFN